MREAGRFGGWPAAAAIADCTSRAAPMSRARSNRARSSRRQGSDGRHLGDAGDAPELALERRGEEAIVAGWHPAAPRRRSSGSRPGQRRDRKQPERDHARDDERDRQQRRADGRWTNGLEARLSPPGVARRRTARREAPARPSNAG
jgi:hypothetical protein